MKRVSTSEPFAGRREYHLSWQRFFSVVGVFAVLFGFRGIGLVLHGNGSVFEIVVLVLLGGLLAGFTWYGLRSGTHVNAAGVTVRRMFASRGTPWADVQAIKVERSPQKGQSNRVVPNRYAVLYDAAGHRRVLPNVHDRNGLDVEREVEALHRMWTEGRGRSWAPVAAAVEAMSRQEELRTRRTSPGKWATLAAILTAIVAFIAFAVIVSGIPDSASPPSLFVEVVLPVVAILGPAAAAFAITLRVTRRRREQERHP